MNTLILANVAAPYILSKTGNILIFMSIIPIEMLVISICFKLSKLTISFSRLFIAVLIANIATSIIGIPLIFNNVISPSPIITLFVLPISFILSFIIETITYSIFIRGKHIPKLKVILAYFLSNLASYIVFLFAIAGVNYDNSESPFLTANPRRLSRDVNMNIRDYIYIQQDFYAKNKHFADNFYELGWNEYLELSLNRFYHLNLQGNQMKNSLIITSKKDDTKSYRVTIFVVKDKFIQAVCETEKPSKIAPETPKLVKYELECPPGSLKLVKHSKPTLVSDYEE